MKNRSRWFLLAPLLLIIIVTLLFAFEESKIFIIGFLTDTFLFVKKNIIAILTAFFLVKGKFVIKLFIRKIILLSATGLGKRYMIERVLNHQIKVHFLDHMRDDFKRLSKHMKDNFHNFPLVKKIMTVFAFIGSLGFVGKFMGGMLAVKVFIAKVWSFLLAVFLKLFTALFYFITKVLWGNWLAPVLEVVLFSWLLTWLEKVPFLKQGLNKIYQWFHYLFGWVEVLMAKLMKVPMRRFLKWLVKKMKVAIYKFIGYERVSRFTRLKEARKLNPNSHTLLMKKRKERIIQREYISAWKRVKKKREQKKPLNKIGFS